MSTEPTPAPTHTPEQLAQAVYQLAAEQLHNGISPSKVEQNLIDKGLDAETARTVVNNLLEARTNVHKQAGQKNMLFGALWCVGGILVTAFTYSAAASGGGRYVIAWGAIVFGGIQFFRGLIQASGSNE